MCEPTTILAVSTALSVATAAVGAKGQHDAAKAQQKSLDIQAQQQAEETAVARDDQIGERMRAARAAAARRLVAAGESGVAGQSTELGILSDFGAANQDAAKVAKQAAFEDRANQNSYRAALSQIQRPNGLTAGLQIAGAGVQGFSSGLAINSAIGGSGLKIASKFPKG